MRYLIFNSGSHVVILRVGCIYAISYGNRTCEIQYAGGKYTVTGDFLQANTLKEALSTVKGLLSNAQNRKRGI